MSTTDLTFNLSIDELRGIAGTSQMDIHLIQNGYPLFGFDKDMHLRLLAEYVPKLYPKSQIKKWLQSNPDKTFLQMIHPSDIAFTVLLIKNSETQWISENNKSDNTRHSGSVRTTRLITQDQRWRGVQQWHTEEADIWRGYVECRGDGLF